MGGALVALALWTVLPTQYGGHLGTTVVSGRSMEPTYVTGDLVLTWRGGDVEVGDVLVYTVPEGDPGEGLHVVHRVADIDDQGHLTMLGDNNDEVDLWRPTVEDVVGTVVLDVPRGGTWMRMLLSPLALALLCGVLVTLAVVTGDRPAGGRGDDGATGGATDGDGDGDGGSGDRTPARAPTRVLARVVALALVTSALGASASSASTLGGVSAADLTSVRSGATPPSGSTAPTAAEATVSVQLTTATNAAYCAEVTVSTTSATPVAWRATLTPARISADPIYRLDAAPTDVQGATTTAFTASSGTWTVTGSGRNDVITATNPTSWTYCSAWSTRAPLDTDTSVSGRVTSQSGAGAKAEYCATVTVTTTSAEWVRWQATVNGRTPGLTATSQRLNSAPTSLTDAVQTAFTGGNGWSLTVRGGPAQAAVKAGSPAVWSYCGG